MTPWPRRDDSGDDGDRPLELYKIAVDEYRFQARYNWSRTQYLLALNVAILAAAAAIASRSGHGAAYVFAIGVVAAALSPFVLQTQHRYYRAARDHMRRVEDDLNLPDRQRIDTTATLGMRGRLLSVNQAVYLFFGLLAVADAVGIAMVVAR